VSSGDVWFGNVRQACLGLARHGESAFVEAGKDWRSEVVPCWAPPSRLGVGSTMGVRASITQSYRPQVVGKGGPLLVEQGK